MFCFDDVVISLFFEKIIIIIDFLFNIVLIVVCLITRRLLETCDSVVVVDVDVVANFGVLQNIPVGCCLCLQLLVLSWRILWRNRMGEGLGTTANTAHTSDNVQTSLAVHQAGVLAPVTEGVLDVLVVVHHRMNVV